MKSGDMSSQLHPDSAAATERDTIHLEKGDTLTGGSCNYVVKHVMGEGGFGKVVECWNQIKMVAIKVPKKHRAQSTQHELSMLNTISALDPDKYNLVRFLESFDYMGYTCLAFEKLDMDLFRLVKLRNFEPMSVSDIRNVAEQLLVSLDALKGLGVMHADIKPDNIMVVSAEESPMRIKLVDFGMAIPASQVVIGMSLQTFGYRSPEVCLGLPFDEAVDIWGLGCVLAYLLLSYNLICNDGIYEMMRSIVHTVGQPPDHLLSEGLYSTFWFVEKEFDDDGPRWRLMTPKEFSEEETIEEPDPDFDLLGGLDDLMKICSAQDQSEREEMEALVHLLKGLLHVEAAWRLTAREALQHPFITRSFHNHNPLNEETLNKETLNQETLQEEPLNEETLNEETLNQETLQEEPLNEETLNKETLNQETLQEEALNEETLNQETLQKEPLNEETLNKETLNQETLQEEALNEETLNQETLQEENLNQEPVQEQPHQEKTLSQEPLDGPSQDSDSGISQLSGTLSDFTDDEETSGSNEGTTSPFGRVKKMMGMVFNTLFCCFNPQTDN